MIQNSVFEIIITICFIKKQFSQIVLLWNEVMFSSLVGRGSPLHYLCKNGFLKHKYIYLKRKDCFWRKYIILEKNFNFHLTSKWSGERKATRTANGRRSALSSAVRFSAEADCFTIAARRAQPLVRWWSDRGSTICYLRQILLSVRSN